MRLFIILFGLGLHFKPISSTDNKQMGMGQLKMGKQNKGPFINTNGLGLQLKPISQNLGSPPTRPTAQNISMKIKEEVSPFFLKKTLG